MTRQLWALVAKSPWGCGLCIRCWTWIQAGSNCEGKLNVKLEKQGWAGTHKTSKVISVSAVPSLHDLSDLHPTPLVQEIRRSWKRISSRYGRGCGPGCCPAREGWTSQSVTLGMNGHGPRCSYQLPECGDSCGFTLLFKSHVKFPWCPL